MDTVIIFAVSKQMLYNKEKLKLVLVIMCSVIRTAFMRATLLQLALNCIIALRNSIMKAILPLIFARKA